MDKFWSRFSNKLFKRLPKERENFTDNQKCLTPYRTICFETCVKVSSFKWHANNV